MVTEKVCVLLVIGGDSTERDVSIDTGKSVYQALRSLGHRVFVTDPLRPEMRPSEDPTEFFAGAGIGKTPPTLSKDRYEARRHFLEVVGQHRNLSCDVVFNALHGGVGEDGTFQAVLDYLGVRYTGSGAAACAVAMNKDLAKRVVAHAGVPVPKQLLIDSSPHEALVTDEMILDTLSLPVVVKPNCEGSSVGVSIVETREALGKAIRAARPYGGGYLVEGYVPGRELTVAVMDSYELPILEIRPKKGFFDYENKYQPDAYDYFVPAPLDPSVALAVQQSARSAYRAIGCRGYARIDFRLNDAGEHYFLEANALPGLTAGSLFPKAARAVGIEYPDLIGTILRLSLIRQAI